MVRAVAGRWEGQLRRKGDEDLAKRQVDAGRGPRSHRGCRDSFVRDGHPSAADSAGWVRFDATGRVMSLRADGESTLIADAQVAAEHHCDFWTS